MATKIVTAHFTNSEVPVTGLTPTVDVYALTNTTDTVVVAGDPLIEIGGGWYKYVFATYDPSQTYVFTIDGGGALPPYERFKTGGNESYTEDIAPAVWDQQTTDHVGTGTTGLMLSQIKADTSSILITDAQLSTLLNTILKYHRNRTKIDLNSAQLIIYDDDGTTPITVFDLKDFNGMPNVQEVCEKVPLAL